MFFKRITVGFLLNFMSSMFLPNTQEQTTIVLGDLIEFTDNLDPKQIIHTVTQPKSIIDRGGILNAITLTNTNVKTK